MKKMFFISVLLGLTAVVTAQISVLEKTYEIEKKSFLTNVETNTEKGTFELIYTRPKLLGGKKKDIYTYDKDLNLVSSQKDVDKENPKSGFKKDKGETYTYKSVSAENNMSGGATFKINETTERFSWYHRRYISTTKELDKLKLKQDDGSKYTFYRSYEVTQDHTVLVLVGKHIKKTWNALMKFDIVHCDHAGSTIVTDSINLEYANHIIYAGKLNEADADNEALSHDWVVVFTPAHGTKPNIDPKPTNLTYIRISPKGKVVEKFNIASVANGWEVAKLTDKDGSIFLSGLAVTKDPEKKYYYEIIGESGKRKYNGVQICKITNGKVDFMSSPTSKDFEAKQSKPSNQKKAVEFTGESVNYCTGRIFGSVFNDDENCFYGSLQFSESGDILFNCQDGNAKDFNNNYLFLFDSKGTFKKYYGVSIKADGSKSGDGSLSFAIPIANFFYTSADGKSIYWMMRSTKLVDCKTTDDKDMFGDQIYTSGLHLKQQTTTCTEKLGIEMCSINAETGEMSEIKTSGRDKKDEYYLYPLTNDIIKMGNYLFCFSKTLKGDKMMLSRIDISK